MSGATSWNQCWVARVRRMCAGRHNIRGQSQSSIRALTIPTKLLRICTVHFSDVVDVHALVSAQGSERSIEVGTENTYMRTCRAYDLGNIPRLDRTQCSRCVVLLLASRHARE